MADHDEVELYRERLPALVDYLKGDQVRRAIESGQPIINITINEAPRTPPPAPPEPNIATKYAGHLILATWSALVLAGLAIALIMIAHVLMTMMISIAVCAVAVAAAVRSLRTSRHDVRMERTRTRKR